MIKKIIMPKVSEVMEGGTIITWLKKEGDWVEKGEPILEIEVEKAVMEWESQEEGYLRKILVKEGETVPIGTVLAYLSDTLEEEIPGEEKITEEVKEEDKREAKRIPLTSMRKTISERLSKSKQLIPHFYVFTEVDMTELVNIKSKQENEIKIDDFIIKATAIALKDFPLINSRFKENEIELLTDINVGFAVALGDEGLVVPVIKKADNKSLKEIAKERQNLIEKARSGKLSLEDISDGSITINNVGVFGVSSILAIINPPEVAIVTTGVIQDKPVVLNGEIKIRKMMEMTLSADHRVIDGAYGSRFIMKVKELLENPGLLTE
ncbi:MAG: 2-oxo acid dehydrogenase subunit E2 [Dictyoglomus sp.]|nr:2-oxo acid dehydrogenase subunit E2 [Dictyoglomus sp.]MDW8188835.1 dihydrolipoamide acetyltransferase family protein [Dictyoglomus sp.]